MSIHSIQNFGIDSIINKLTKMKNSLQPDITVEGSFTFQNLPKESEGSKLNKLPYLQSDIYELTQEGDNYSDKNMSKTIDFFDSVQDFHARKQQISKIQNKYLSTVSNETQEKRKKLKIFTTMPLNNKPLNKTIKSQNKQNWLQEKGNQIKNVLNQLHSAMTQCYSHFPQSEKILQKFDKIAKRS